MEARARHTVRVFFTDGTFTTVEIGTETTTAELLETISRRRHNDSSEHSLHVIDSNPFLSLESQFSRQVNDHERPFLIFQAILDHGHVYHFRFLYRTNAMDLIQDREVRRDFDREIASKFKDYDLFGYVDQLGRRSRNWKEQFLAIRDGKLFCFKSHSHKTPHKVIELHNCVISELDQLARQGHVFEVLSPSSHLILRASTLDEMNLWVSRLLIDSSVEPENAEFEECQFLVDFVESRVSKSFEDAFLRLCQFDFFCSKEEAMSQFLEKLRQSHSEENLLFWMDIDKLKKVEDHRKEFILKECKRIYLTFIDKNAPYLIDSKGSFAGTIKSLLNAGDVIVREKLIEFQKDLKFFIVDLFRTFFLPSIDFKLLVLSMAPELPPLFDLLVDAEQLMPPASSMLQLVRYNHNRFSSMDTSRQMSNASSGAS